METGREMEREKLESKIEKCDRGECSLLQDFYTRKEKVSLSLFFKLFPGKKGTRRVGGKEELMESEREREDIESERRD